MTKMIAFRPKEEIYQEILKIAQANKISMDSATEVLVEYAIKKYEEEKINDSTTTKD